MTGAEVISELIFELDASVEAAAGFEGEMQRLAGYARCVAPTGKQHLPCSSPAILQQAFTCTKKPKNGL